MTLALLASGQPLKTYQISRKNKWEQIREVKQHDLLYYTVSILQSSTTQTLRLSCSTRRLLQREGHAEDGLCLTCWRCARYMNHVLKRSWSQSSHCNRKELVRAQLSCACRRFQCHGAEHRFSGHCGRHESPAPIGQLRRPRGRWELCLLPDPGPFACQWEYWIR